MKNKKIYKALYKEVYPNILESLYLEHGGRITKKDRKNMDSIIKRLGKTLIELEAIDSTLYSFDEMFPAVKKTSSRLFADLYLEVFLYDCCNFINHVNSSNSI